mmetsp:Transcript_16621/g.18821  ORF Transcript_16621/g.18821 Transcript_16621/m.18821 type:complete len:286 (-) Transcript_16621:122-979(-)
MTSAFPGLEEVANELYLDSNLPETQYTYQERGYLSSLNSKFSPMKLCAVKDGFFLWYSAESAGPSFDTKPQGLIPLQSCSIYTDTRDPSGTTFTISNPSLPGAHVTFQAGSVERTRDWLEACENGKKASLANGALGHALVEQLQNRDKKRDDELQEAVEKLKKNALETKKALEAKQKILKRQQMQRMRHEEELDQALAEKKALEKKKKQNEQKLKNLSKEEAKAQKQKAKMEKSLEEVKGTLIRLEEVLLGVEDDVEVRKSISFLNGFVSRQGRGLREEGLKEDL